MFLKDAPFLEVPELMKAQMKVTIDKKLFQNIKLYESQEDVQNVVGYVFHDIEMNGNHIWDKLERTQVWSAACGLILFHTSELWQQAFEQYYASCGKHILWYDLSGKIIQSNIYYWHHFWQKHGSKTSHFQKLKHCWMLISQHIRRVGRKLKLACSRIWFGSFSRWYWQSRRDGNLSPWTILKNIMIVLLHWMKHLLCSLSSTTLLCLQIGNARNMQQQEERQAICWEVN